MTGGELGWRSESQSAARIVAPEGRVDEPNAIAFADRLGEEIATAAAAGATLLVIDLAAVAYMSSRGLRALTLAQRKAGDSAIKVVLARPNAVMREILAISRYDLVFRVVESIDEALSA